MKQIFGNLIDLAEQGDFDTIVHGCNCFHAMRNGIAKEIAFRYPEVKLADLRTPYGDRKKLSRFSTAEVERVDGSTFTVVNAYTQYRWSNKEDVFEYDFFDTLLNRLSQFLFYQSEQLQEVVRVGFPKIGCGLAGGDPERILPMLETFSKDVEGWARVTLVLRE